MGGIFLIFFFEEYWTRRPTTLESGQRKNIGSGKFDKNNKHRALNKRRAWKIWQKFEDFCYENMEKIIFPIFDNKSNKRRAWKIRQK